MVSLGSTQGRSPLWPRSGILINQAVVVHDGVGYLSGFRDPAVHAAIDAADRLTFEHLLAQVSFPG